MVTLWNNVRIASALQQLEGASCAPNIREWQYCIRGQVLRFLLTAIKVVTRAPELVKELVVIADIQLGLDDCLKFR